jgi:hypothetical protein
VAANSRLQGSSAVAQVAGPSAGGLLVQALTAPAAMLFDALLTQRWGLGPVMIAALFLETLSRLVLPFAAGPPLEAAGVVMVSQALLGLIVPLWTVSSNSLQQAVTPERLLGRVSAATRFISLGVAPPSAFAAGVLADHIGMRPTLFASGLIAAAAATYLLVSPVRGFMRPPALAE